MIYIKVIIYILQALSVFLLCMASYLAGRKDEMKKHIKERARMFETDNIKKYDK